MFGVTYIARTYYAVLKQESESWGWNDEYLYAWMSMGQHYFVLAAGAVVYTSLYWFELPFFEQYKAFDEPWPWKADRKKWQELLI